MPDTVRPSPWQWLRYLAGRPLPERYSAWVLHDTTGPTWVLRHVVRIFILLAVVAVPCLIWLPMPVGLKIGAIAAGVVMGLLYGVAYIEESTSMRLARAGFDPRIGPERRRDRAEAKQRAQAERRRAKRAAAGRRY